MEVSFGGRRIGRSVKFWPDPTQEDSLPRYFENRIIRCILIDSKAIEPVKGTEMHFCRAKD